MCGRRFPDDRVAADGREHRVPGPNGDRKIESRDHADRAERMPLLEHAVQGPFAGHGQAVKLPRETDGEIAHVDHFLHFAFALRADLARLERDEQAQVLLLLAQGLADLADDFAPLGGWDHPPALNVS